ncbi:MAG: sigma-70 family RNA polymerase sigma factor, partial [Pseudomonadota bacterium]
SAFGARCEASFWGVLMSADLAAFEAAYREHFAFAWRSLRRLGVPERDLGDAAQDVFVVVSRKLHEFDHARPLKVWLYAICLRVASDRRRSAAHRHELLAEESEVVEQPERATLAHAERQQNAERRALLEAALDEMPLDQRATFTLFELEGRTGDEVAALLEVPVATVHSRLRLAREVFRRSIERQRAREQFEMRSLGGER